MSPAILRDLGGDAGIGAAAGLVRVEPGLPVLDGVSEAAAFRVGGGLHEGDEARAVAAPAAALAPAGPVRAVAPDPDEIAAAMQQQRPHPLAALEIGDGG